MQFYWVGLCGNKGRYRNLSLLVLYAIYGERSLHESLDAPIIVRQGGPLIVGGFICTYGLGRNDAHYFDRLVHLHGYP